MSIQTASHPMQGPATDMARAGWDTGWEVGCCESVMGTFPYFMQDIGNLVVYIYIYTIYINMLLLFCIYIWNPSETLMHLGAVACMYMHLSKICMNPYVPYAAHASVLHPSCIHMPLSCILAALVGTCYPRKGQQNPEMFKLYISNCVMYRRKGPNPSPHSKSPTNALNTEM